jgi:hypothetical protein
MIPLWQRALGGLAVIAAVVALVVVFTSSGDDSRPISRFPSAVQRVVPAEGQLVVRQARVGIVLEQGFEAELVVDDIPIPKDQMIVNEALGEYLYQPGEGQEIEAFQEGQRCVTAVITNRVHPEEDPPDPTWCFNVA